MSEVHDNPAFVSDIPNEIISSKVEEGNASDREERGRDNWGRGIEFLLSCIAMSVGLGNVWRFPFVALDNGGGMLTLNFRIRLEHL